MSVRLPRFGTVSNVSRAKLNAMVPNWWRSDCGISGRVYQSNLPFITAYLAYTVTPMIHRHEQLAPLQISAGEAT